MTEPLRDEEVSPDAASEHRDHLGDDAPGSGMPQPTAVESLVNALLDAGPEVAEHVVRAAQELLLAVQVIVDAADRAVKEQQTISRDRAEEQAPPATHEDAGVRHLDLAE
jgi:hypothetical protein